MKIAIVGGGISGLTAAYLLHKDHDITLFEANNYVGGHTHTIDLMEKGKRLSVDTGFIVFNEHNYPNLCRLFDALDIESRDSDMSFSVHCEKTGLEYNGANLNSLFSQRSNLFNPSFLGMLKDIHHFHQHAPKALCNGLGDTTTVSQFAEKYRYGREFVELYLVPLGASLWSCPANEFRRFPVRFVLEFLDNHCMLQVNNRPSWKTVVGGSQAYVWKMAEQFRSRIIARSPVKSIVRRNSHIELQPENGDLQFFDEVIMATHADQSLKLVKNLEVEEFDVLEQFKYIPNEAVLHTDTSVLPDNRLTWASWNYRIPKVESRHVTVSYNMNMLQGLECEQTYCVSLNQSDHIDPRRVIQRITYHHPMFQPGRDHAQAQHKHMVRRRGISYCGAYWGYGFHEDGVNSALAVCDAFGKELK